MAFQLRKSYLINGNLRNLVASAPPANTTLEVAQNTFDPANPSQTRYAISNASGFNMSNQLLDRAVFNGSFLRVRNLTLGYTFRGGLLQQVKISSVRFYLTGQNLLTFTSYPFYNPEASINAGTSATGTTNTGVIRPGLDLSGYPATRTYIAGLNFSF